MKTPAKLGTPAGLRLPGAADGRVLRLKVGYNPNSSSIGTIVFGMPATLAVATVAFGAAAGVLCAALLRARASRDAQPPAAEGTDATGGGGRVVEPERDDETRPTDRPNDGEAYAPDEPTDDEAQPPDEPTDDEAQPPDEPAGEGEARPP